MEAPATISWPPPAIPTAWTAVPATTSWSPPPDTRADTFVFRPGSGQDSITGFEGANGDVVDLRGFGLANLAALAPYVSQAGADTVITLNGADILTLKNVNAAMLAADDFMLV